MDKWLLGDLLVKHKIAVNKTEVQTLCCLYVKAYFLLGNCSYYEGGNEW